MKPTIEVPLELFEALTNFAQDYEDYIEAEHDNNAQFLEIEEAKKLIEKHKAGYPGTPLVFIKL